KKRKKAITDYVNFVQAGVGLPGVWDSLRGQIYLGSETFVNKMQLHMKSDQNISEIPRAQRRPMAKPLSHYSSFSDRNEGIVTAYQTGDYTMKQIADEFGLHYATVSRVIKKAEGN
ncbi:MAG: addiction module toxin RelE, partial [Nitrosomonas sp.]|nr:addiction module toxin RelE [Nitrosomonas sp.]